MYLEKSQQLYSTQSMVFLTALLRIYLSGRKGALHFIHMSQAKDLVVLNIYLAVEAIN